MTEEGVPADAVRTIIPAEPVPALAGRKNPYGLGRTRVRATVRYAVGTKKPSSDWKRRTWYAESPNATPMAVRRFR